MGELTKNRDPKSFTDNKYERAKVVGQAALSILAISLAMGAEVACAFGHLFKPEYEGLDHLAVRLWTGGRAKFESPRDQRRTNCCSQIFYIKGLGKSKEEFISFL